MELIEKTTLDVLTIEIDKYMLLEIPSLLEDLTDFECQKGSQCLYYSIDSLKVYTDPKNISTIDKN